MPDEVKIEREALEGTGKIIVVKVRRSDSQLTSNGLIRIGDKWFWTAGLFQSSSLVSLIRKILGQTTTTKFRDFLLRFGLTLQDLFDNNPDDTTKYIQGICEELIDNVRLPQDVHIHTLRNLREWLDSLNPGPADQLRKILQDTIATLDNLLRGDTNNSPQAQAADEALRKMADSQ